jgi:hypothetical protein
MGGTIRVSRPTDNRLDCCSETVESTRGGGLGGGAGRRFSDGFSFCLSPSPSTVDADDDEVEDSRTDERACCCRMLVSSGVLCLTTGGLL